MKVFIKKVSLFSIFLFIVNLMCFPDIVKSDVSNFSYGDKELQRSTDFNNVNIKKVIENNDTINIKVEKLWDGDDEYNRPKNITIKLFCDGKDTGKNLNLTSENDWTGEFEGLFPRFYNGPNGEKLEHNYTIKELALDNYDPSYTYSYQDNSIDTSKLQLWVPATEIKQDEDYIVVDGNSEGKHNLYRAEAYQTNKVIMGQVNIINKTIKDEEGINYNNYIIINDQDDSSDYLTWKAKKVNNDSNKFYLYSNALKLWNGSIGALKYRDDNITVPKGEANSIDQEFYGTKDINSINNAYKTETSNKNIYLYKKVNLSKNEFSNKEILYSVKEEIPFGYTVKYDYNMDTKEKSYWVPTNSFVDGETYIIVTKAITGNVIGMEAKNNKKFAWTKKNNANTINVSSGPITVNGNTYDRYITDEEAMKHTAMQWIANSVGLQHGNQVGDRNAFTLKNVMNGLYAKDTGQGDLVSKPCKESYWYYGYTRLDASGKPAKRKPSNHEDEWSNLLGSMNDYFLLSNNHTGDANAVEAQTFYLYKKVTTKNPSIEVKLKKISSETSKPLANSEFELYNSINEKLGSFTTKENGEVSLGYLQEGDYKLKEINPPKGYILSKDFINFKVKNGKAIQDENEVEFITVSNIPNSIRIKKTDDSKLESDAKFLSGAKFELNKVNDQKFKPLVKETDDKGEIEFKEIEPGTYYLKEVLAPNGYEQIKEDIGPIVVDNTGVVTIPWDKLKSNDVEKWNNQEIIRIKNKKLKSAIYIDKVDAINPEIKLSGAKFSLYTNDENYKNNKKLVRNGINYYLISEKLSNDKGRLEWENLNSGEEYKYLIQETEAPKGYTVSGKEILFHFKDNIALIDNENDVKALASINGQVISIKNAKIYKLPSSGGIGVYPFLLIGTLCMALSLIYSFNSKFSNKKK